MDMLKDWRPGDTITAGDLQRMVEAVRELEVRTPALPMPVYGGGRTPECDGAQEWPWQVYLAPTADGVKLRVVPGEVLVALEGVYDPQYIQIGVRSVYAKLSQDNTSVQDVESLSRRVIVYLEMRGEVTVEPMSEDLMPDDSIDGDDYEVTSISDVSLRVTVSPAQDALRLWPLAVYDPAHAQPLTQLQWGLLSACELRGVCGLDDQPVPPTDRGDAEAWGAAGHSDGMAVLAEVNAYGMVGETFEGALHACMDKDGAFEFYLGEKEQDDREDSPPGDSPGGGVLQPWTPDDDDDDDDDSGGGGGGGGGDNDAPEPTPRPPGVTRVKYGYVAGEGFASCDLMQVGDKLMWVLTLDPGYLCTACANLTCKGTVVYTAGGAASGVLAAIDMGLQGARATASGVICTGSTGLVFHGTNNVDTSCKQTTVTVTYKCSPAWEQARTWHLSPDELHEAGKYVLRDVGTTYSNPFIRANQWYRFRVDKEMFAKHAQQYFRAQLSQVQLSDTATSDSGDASVKGQLGGSMLSISVELTLS